MTRNIKMNQTAFESTLSSFELKVATFKEILSEIDAQMNRLDGPNRIWQGVAQKLLCKNYNDISSKYSSINNRLDEYVKFLKESLEDYKNATMKISKSAEDNEANLDIV